MAKIPRKTAVIFGGSALAAPGGIEQFGSTQSGLPIYSLDLAVIQNLPAWVQGWGAAAINLFPVQEDLNAAHYVHSTQIAYLLQQGVAEWDSGTNYFTNSIVQTGGLLYISLVDNNLNNAPASSPSDWQVFASNPTKGENLFRNGGMQVAQRGTSGTVTAATPVYTLDGWILNSTGANLAWQQDLVNGKRFLTLTGSGSTTDSLIKQRIESLISQELQQNDWVTVQFILVNGTGANVTPKLTVNIPTAQDNYSSVTTIVNAQNMTTISGTGTVEGVVAYTFNVGANNIQNGLEIIIDFGTAQAAGAHILKVGEFDCSKTPTLQVTGIQTNIPLAQVRPIGVEIPFCQRYLKSWGGNSLGELLGMGIVQTTSELDIWFSFGCTMRAVPSLSFSATGDWSANTPAAQAVCTGLTFESTGSGLSTGQIAATVAGTPFTVGQPGTLNASSTNNARLWLSAEL